MGTISIFSLEFSGTQFACARDFTGGYRLQAAGYTVAMEPNVAGALAFGGQRIRLRAQMAVRAGSDMKPGAAFRRDLLAVNGRMVHIEIGVGDSGTDVYIEIAGSRMSLVEEQAKLLLFSLDRLRDDVNAMYRASERAPDLTVAQGLRGFLYPWETGPTW